MRVRVRKRWPGGTTADEEWDDTPYHCPNCGEKSVWRETGEGDLYLGVPHVCVACNSIFYMPLGPETAKTDNDLDVYTQVVKQIRGWKGEPS